MANRAPPVPPVPPVSEAVGAYYHKLQTLNGTAAKNRRTRKEEEELLDEIDADYRKLTKEDKEWLALVNASGGKLPRRKVVFGRPVSE